MLLKCENYLCIYQKNNQCILDNISLDELGMCDQCIYVDVEEGELNTIKKKMLDYYGKINNR